MANIACRNRHYPAAYQKIGQCYEKAGAHGHQVCRLYDAPHQFNAEMQAEAWQFFRKWL